jgi:hypothetical protein
MTINFTYALTGKGSLTSTSDLSSVFDNLGIGQGNFDAINNTLSDGTGNNQAQSWAHDEITIATTANADLDLTAMTNNFGAVAFSKIKFLLIDIDSPDGTKAVRVGPQNVTNGWQGPWGGVGATVYQEVFTQMLLVHPYAGWTVTNSSADILRINNPTAGSVTLRYLIIGLT